LGDVGEDGRKTDWVELAQQWALLNTVMNHRIRQKAGNVLDYLSYDQLLKSVPRKDIPVVCLHASQIILNHLTKCRDTHHVGARAGYRVLVS
jgi:hypothetical protein